MGRSAVGFVRIQDAAPSSLGSGTLIRFGNIVGVLTCAHVLEAVCKEAEIGILCFPIRTNQIQTLRLPMSTTDCISIGSPPWSERGPDLAFLRLPTTIIGDIERVATIANGDLHRQRIIEGEPVARHVCGLVGVVDEFTKRLSVVRTADRTVGTTSFDLMINLGNLIIDDEDADRFRFQPLASPGAALPRSYQIKGVVWTALKPKFANEYRKPSVEEVTRYLAGSGVTKARAEEYVRRAPVQIRTPYRDRIERELGWHPITLES
jgi:hypothetical protein